MSLQKYYVNQTTPQSDGAILHHNTYWRGGPLLGKVSNARMPGLHGEPRVTAYVQGEADTWFAVPCKFWFKGKVLNGYLTGDDSGNLIVQHCYY